MLETQKGCKSFETAWINAKDVTGSIFQITWKEHGVYKGVQDRLRKTGISYCESLNLK